MVKYCKSCGKEYKGDYCEHCGYGKDAGRAKAYDKYKSNRKLKEEKIAREKEAGKNKSTSKGQIAVIVVIILGIIGVMIWAMWRDGIINFGDKTDPIVNYFEAIAENDYDKYVATMPKAIAETYDKYLQESDIDKNNFIRESYADYYQLLGDTFTVEVSCGEEAKLSDEVVSEAETEFKNNFGESISVKEAYKVSTEVKFIGSNASETYFFDVYIARIGFKWYILDIDDYYELNE